MDDDVYWNCVRWATDPSMFKNKKQDERRWGNEMRTRISQKTKETSNWTTIVGEYLVKETLERTGRQVWRPSICDGCLPDWETMDAMWEVKTRTWNTSGTAGEKILGVPYKYANVVRSYGKPLRIVCLAYQETEADKKWSLFAPQKTEQRALVNVWDVLGIRFIRFSDLFLSSMTIQ